MKRKKNLEEASRVIMDTGPSNQSELTKIKTIDKTQKSVNKNKEEYIDFVLEELAKNAGPNTFIRYENKYNDLEVPLFKVSPIITHETPHGIYGYPLDEINVISLVASGLPARSRFTTNYTHFHLYRITDERQALMPKSKKDLSYTQIYSKYRTSVQVKKDIAECIRSFIIMLKRSSSSFNINVQKTKSDILADFNNYNLNDKMPHIFLSDLVEEYKDKLFYTVNDKEKNILYKFIKELTEIFYSFSSRNISISANSRLNAINNFKILKKALEHLASACSIVYNTKRGSFYSLFLHLVGIDSIKDEGSGTIHQNEPNQAVAADFSGRNIVSIGTYDNIFNMFSDGRIKVGSESDFEPLYNRFLDLLDTKNNKINFDMSKIDYYFNRHTINKEEYEDFNLDKFKSTISEAFKDMNLYYKWSGNTNAGKNPFSLILQYSPSAKEIFKYAYSLGEEKLNEIFFGLLEALEIDVEEFLDKEKSMQDSIFQNAMSIKLNESILKSYIKSILS